MGRPLRSTPITGASSLLRTGPPARPASVLNTSQFLLLGALPLTTPNLRAEVSGPAFPRSMQQPQIRIASPVCRTPPGQKRAPARLLPGLGERPGFDVLFAISTLHQRFTCVRLPDPHLTPQGSLFLIAHHTRHSTGAA